MDVNAESSPLPPANRDGGAVGWTRGRAVDASPFAVGEVSFHSALCFHTAGPNRSTQPRRALSTTYYADGARVLEWQYLRRATATPG